MSIYDYVEEDMAFLVGMALRVARFI